MSKSKSIQTKKINKRGKRKRKNNQRRKGEEKLIKRKK